MFWKSFPVLLTAPFVIGAVRLFWEWLTLPGGAKSPFADLNPLVFVFPILVGTVAFRVLGGLKRVFLKGDRLAVSNYLKEIEIPLSDVERVSGPENSSHRRIAIQLRTPSSFGDEIVFMPPLFGAREAADALRSRAKVNVRPDDFPTGRALAAHVKRYREILKGKIGK